MRKVSPSMFALIVLCFFLPFMNLSCQGEKIATLSGVNLVTGTTIQLDTGLSKQSERVDPVGAAGIAILAALAGAALYFWHHKLQSVAGAALGLVGAIALLAMKSGMAEKLAKDNVTVEAQAGFTLSVLLFVGAALWNVYLTLLAPDAPFRVVTGQPPGPGASGSEHHATGDQRNL